jgi:tetratricopeptide (TPR) repeat protein
LPDDNKEKSSPEDKQDEDSETKGAGLNNSDEQGDDWKWDADVPITAVEGLDVDELLSDAETIAKEKDKDNKKEESQKENDPEEETEPEENKKSDVCIVCGKKLGKSPSDLYCMECRAKFLRTNYGAGHIILAFVMVLVAAIGYFVCVSTCDISNQLVKAQSYVNDRQYNNAVNECSKITTTVSTVNSGVNAVFKGINSNFTSKDWFSEGTRATLLVLNAYTDTISVNSDECDTFISAVDSTFNNNKGLNISRYPRIKNCYAFCKDVNSVTTEVTDKLNTYLSGDGTANYVIPYDETISYLESVATTNDYQKSMIYYYESITAYYAKKDNATILGLYKKAYDTAGDYNYTFVPSYIGLAWQLKEYDTLLSFTDAAIARNANDTTSYYYAVKTYIVKNDFDKANELCETMKANNPDGIDYYSIKAEVLRREGKYDDAVQICKDGLKVGTDAEIYRQQAIAYMLLDDKDSALDAIKESYSTTLKNASSNSSVSMEVMNTSALITFLCNDTETYNEITSMFKEQSVDLYDSVTKCINGDITFEEIFTEGTGDVQ